MSAKNSEYPPPKKHRNSYNPQPKKKYPKKNYFNSSSKKYHIQEKELSSPKKEIANPKEKDSPEPEDEYKGLMYNPPIYHPPMNAIIICYEPEKALEFNNYRTKLKTEICRYWEMNGECKYGENCAFAHGESELKKRKLTFNYKKKPCKQFFELGYCSYGIRCQFSHKKEDLIHQQNKINNLEENKDNNNISYLKIIKEFLSDGNNNISHELVKRPRLNTFENITSCSLQDSENSKLKLYEDIINIKSNNNNIKNIEGEKNNNKFKNSEDSYHTNVSSDNNDNETNI